MTSVEEQEKAFRNWMKHENTGKGALLDSTINHYIHYMKAAYANFNEIKDYESVFDIQNSKELNEYITKLFETDGFTEFNWNNGHSSCRSGFIQYKAFVEDQERINSGQRDFLDVLNHNLYGINMTEKNTALCDDNPHISIGWSELGDLTDINDYATLGTLYDEKYPNDKDRTYNLGVVWKIRSTIEIGDYLVYAYGNTFNIGRVTSEYYYDSAENQDQDPDYVNSRKVKWLIKNRSKTDLHQALSNSMIGRGLTIWDMNKHRAAIRELLAGTYQKGNWENNPSVPNSEDTNKLVFNTEVVSAFAKNRIVFGAPGTGKSFLLNEDRKVLLGEENEKDYERVTFHPDYSYASFVGTYKPVMVKNDELSSLDERQKRILAVLNDDSKTAQEKYDLLYDDFKNNNLTSLPLLISIVSNEFFETKKVDGNGTANNNSIARSRGNAISPFVKLRTSEDFKKEISYEYVPGPFMRILVKALKSAMSGEDKPYLLLIEEINRANVAAVFGDVFQLLDRDKSGVSDFYITTSEDMRAYLAEELGVDESKVESLKIPNNMFIWATMNSADQGVYPMDTAFKRRWDFEYLSIDDKEEKIENLKFRHIRTGRSYAWNDLRKAINNALIGMNVNEDKLLGPFFLKESAFTDDRSFAAAFKSKVLMYLFEDAARQKRSQLFAGCGKECNVFSKVCQKFDAIGIGVFSSDFVSKVPVLADDEQDKQIVQNAQEDK